MQFDIKKTISLIKGGLLDHEATWRNYLAENNSWKQTAVLLTGPLIIFSLLCQIVFSRLIGGWSVYGYPGANIVVAIVLGFIMAVIGVVVLSGACHLLAGQMGGKKNFGRAFAAVSLALIPSYVAGAIAALIPWFGFLIGLAGFVVALVFLWKIMPMALEVPQEKRTLHYVLSLVAAFIVNAVLGVMLAGSLIGNSMPGSKSSFPGRSDSSGTSGMFSEMERQGELVEAAQTDRFEPPSDGKVDDDQVEELIGVMQKTEAARERYAEKMRKMSEEMENKEKPSLGDLTKVYSGFGGAVGAANAEMEVVKTGGGNWAEHQWVKNQLRTAIIQQGEGSDAIEHNYALYREYEDELSEYF